MSISMKIEDQNYQSERGFWPVTLRVQESFEEFVRLNPDLHVEQKSKGEILILSPTGGES